MDFCRLLTYTDGKVFMVLCTITRILEGCGVAMFDVASASLALHLTPSHLSGKMMVRD